MQPTHRLAQRRTQEQPIGAFTFWFRRPHSARHVGAWMLDRDGLEGAFLTTAGEAPSLGEQLELSQPYMADPAAAGSEPDSGAHLPRFGRVVRLDDPQGATCRVAIRFDCEPQATRT